MELVRNISFMSYCCLIWYLAACGPLMFYTLCPFSIHIYVMVLCVVKVWPMNNEQ